MKLSIIIPVFNKWNFTKSCISDLVKLPNDHEIIIIDNASSDETQLELSKINDSKFVIVRNKENIFHSKACNQGYVLARSNNILFINNDIKVRSNYNNWTQSIISACEDNILVGPTMGLLDNQLNFVKEANQYLTGNSYIGGWCIAANKNTWNKLEVSKNEVWNEKFPMYFNDTDLSFRAKKLGIKLNVISLPDVVHFGKISATQLNINKLYNEGRAVFLQKWKKK